MRQFGLWFASLYLQYSLNLGARPRSKGRYLTTLILLIVPYADDNGGGSNISSIEPKKSSRFEKSVAILAY